MRHIAQVACLLCLSWFAMPALAADSPVGTWNQVDDDSGKVTSVIRITENEGTLSGTVLEVKNMTPEQIARDGQPPKCTQCEGERHNQPIEGMDIMWGLTRDGDHWEGGHIIDPSSGKVYKVKLSLTDQGQHLKVRGYIGFSLLGRTQVWQRVD